MRLNVGAQNLAAREARCQQQKCEGSCGTDKISGREPLPIVPANVMRLSGRMERTEVGTHDVL